MSAEKESGKTRALEMTRLFVPAPELFFDPSPAVIIRLVSMGHKPDTDELAPCWDERSPKQKCGPWDLLGGSAPFDALCGMPRLRAARSWSRSP